MSDKTYVSVLPNCGIHQYMLKQPGVPAKYDAKTNDGRWANVCEPCFREHTPGLLGTGRGQELIVGEEPEIDTRALVAAALRNPETTYEDLEELIGDGDPADYF